MDNTVGPNENDTSQEIYPRSTRKRQSQLGRSGLTRPQPKPERYKTLLSTFEKNFENEECYRKNDDSLVCANDSLLNSLEFPGTDSSNTDFAVEVDHEHSTCLSNTETLLNNLNLHGSQRSGAYKGDNSQTYEPGCSNTETQNPSLKTTNKMHETMTHPVHRAAISFFHHSTLSKDVIIQSSSTLDSSQKFVPAHHQCVNKLPSHKETEEAQALPLLSNKDVFSAKSNILQDIPNNADMVISRMRTPFKAINAQSYAVAVSENHISNANSSSLYNKENVVPPFTFSTPAKPESICGDFENVFRTLNLTGRKDGQGPFTPLPKPSFIPSLKTPVSENTKANASVFQQRLGVFPAHFSNNNQANEVAMDLSLSSSATKTVLSAKVGDEASNAALHEVGSSSSQRGPQNDACQSQKNDGKCFIVNGKKYKVESLLGRGGSSKVYQVLHPDTLEHLAIKCVNLSDTEPEIAQGYHNEIKLLQKLQGSENVIRMFDYEYVPDEQILYVVLEKGETDLSKVLKGLSNTSQLPIPTVISYWLEMLAAVKSIHSNGIIHSDLKPANFLIINGHLKLIDFGIASSLQNGMTSVSKDIATGTFNYMSPEAIQDPTDSDGNNSKIKINYKSDIWSLGCILYNLLYGKTPFQHIKQVWAKLATIKNCRTQINYPPLPLGCPGILLKALKLCLQHDPKQRPSAEELQVLPYQGYHQLELLVNRIKQEILANSNSEDAIKAVKTLIYKYQTGSNN